MCAMTFGIDKNRLTKFAEEGNDTFLEIERAFEEYLYFLIKKNILLQDCLLSRIVLSILSSKLLKIECIIF